MLKLITVQFDYDNNTMYKKLLDAFIYSIEKNVGHGEIITLRLGEPTGRERMRAFVSNTIKLQKWVEELEACDEGDEVILMDCDMLVLKDPSTAFKKDFDVAYTIRNHSKFKINGGVIYVKVNKRSLDFFRLFLKINNLMYKNQTFHMEWKKEYAGMNQAAFGYLIDKDGFIKSKNEMYKAKLITLPCNEWNVCQAWGLLKDDMRVLHIKGRIRNQIFSQSPCDDDLKPAVELWNQYYEESVSLSIMDS